MSAETATRESHAREWLIVVLVALGIIGTAWLIGPRRFYVTDTDKYLAMVQRGANAAPAPFAYRVLVPALVGRLPVSPPSGFLLTNFVASLATLVAMYALWRRWGVAKSAALLTLPLLGLSFPVAFYLGNWGLIDPLPQLCGVLTLYAVVRQRWWPAALLIAVGCLAKETSLLLVPLLAWNMARRDAGTARFAKLAVAIALPVAAFVAVRYTVTPLPGSWDVHGLPDLLRRLDRIWSYNVSGFGLPLRAAREFLRSYGFVWVTAGLGFTLLRERRLELLYLAGAGLALCALAADWSRMLGWGFVGFFVPTAVFIDRVHARLGGRIPAALALLALVQGYLSLLAYKDLSRSGQFALVAGSLAVFASGAALCFLAWRRMMLLDRATALPR